MASFQFGEPDFAGKMPSLQIDIQSSSHQMFSKTFEQDEISQVSFQRRSMEHALIDEITIQFQASGYNVRFKFTLSTKSNEINEVCELEISHNNLIARTTQLLGTEELAPLPDNEYDTIRTFERLAKERPPSDLKRRR